MVHSYVCLPIGAAERANRVGPKGRSPCPEPPGDSLQEAWTRENEVLVLNVGKICEEAGLEGEAAHVAFCKVLDSDRFVRNHTLWYHHRRGAWVTEQAEYTFLLDISTRGALLDQPPAWPWRSLRALLWMAIFAVTATSIWGVRMLVLL